MFTCLEPVRVLRVGSGIFRSRNRRISLALLNAVHGRSPNPVTARSAAASLLELRFPIPPGGHWYLSVVSAVCYQVEFSASGWSLVQRSSTVCGASELNVVCHIGDVFAFEFNIPRLSFYKSLCFPQVLWPETLYTSGVSSTCCILCPST